MRRATHASVAAGPETHVDAEDAPDISSGADDALRYLLVELEEAP
jgi:hypothetical protein